MVYFMELWSIKTILLLCESRSITKEREITKKKKKKSKLERRKQKSICPLIKFTKDPTKLD